LINSLGRRIALGAILLASGNLLSRIIGFFREPVVASLFGTTGYADAFELSTRLPTMIFDVAIGGAMSAILIPLFSSRNLSPNKASALFFSIAALIGAIVSVIVIILMLSTELIIDVLAPSFSQDTRNIAIIMLRITLPAALILSISALASGRLYSLEKFIYPSLSVSAMNGTLIVFALALTPIVGPTGVAIGYLLGSIAHLSIQIPGLINTGMRPAMPQIRNNPALKSALILYAPILLGLLFAQSITLVDTYLATRSGEGSLAMMRYATRLQQLPLGLIVAAISIASLPTLSKLAPKNASLLSSSTDFRDLLYKLARYMMVIMMPISVLIVGLADPIIHLVYVRGMFGMESVKPTANALSIYGLQLPFVAIDQLVIFAYYSIRNTITPAVLGGLGGIVYLLVALPSVDRIGFTGLVWANTAQNIFHGITLSYLMFRALKGTFSLTFIKDCARLGIATMICAIVLLVCRNAIDDVTNSISSSILLIIFSSFACLITYIAALHLLRVRELAEMANTITSLVRNRQPNHH